MCSEEVRGVRGKFPTFTFNFLITETVYNIIISLSEVHKDPRCFLIIHNNQDWGKQTLISLMMSFMCANVRGLSVVGEMLLFCHIRTSTVLYFIPLLYLSSDVIYVIFWYSTKLVPFFYNNIIRKGISTHGPLVQAMNYCEISLTVEQFLTPAWINILLHRVFFFIF